MSKSLTQFSAALLLTNALPVLAASTVDLTVKGLITPSACTPNLPGAVDFGKISAKDLNLDSQTPLPTQTVQLSVSCEASTLFAIKPFDNRAGSSTRPASFGLGLINETEKLGRYFLTMRNPVADKPSTLLVSYTEGRWTWLAEDDTVEPNYLIALGVPGRNDWLAASPAAGHERGDCAQHRDRAGQHTDAHQRGGTGWFCDL